MAASYRRLMGISIDTAHLPSMTTPGRSPDGDSGQAPRRRPQYPVDRCSLPDLAGFTGPGRVGPNLQQHCLEK